MGATWPTTLPKAPLRDGFNYEDVDGRAATDVQQGAPRVRRLYENTPRIYNLTFLMTPAQVLIWEAFYKTTLAGGSVAVDLPVVTPAGLTIATVLIVKRSPAVKGAGVDYLIGFQAVTA